MNTFDLTIRCACGRELRYGNQPVMPPFMPSRFTCTGCGREYVLTLREPENTSDAPH